MKNPLKNIGPGVLVAAAFIGPGTVTVCVIAGVKFGYGLLWALVLSIVATILLQETAARIGLATQKSLSQVLRDELKPSLRKLILGLVFSAIVLGNIAYEGGNISGGLLGFELLGVASKGSLLGVTYNLYAWFIGGIAFIFLYIGNYKILERFFIFLIGLMSISFVITAILTAPNILEIIKNSFIPSLSAGNMLTVVALIGTTVVPYNLFLHASLVNQKWRSPKDIPAARKDTVVAVILGGLISMCIVITASAIPSSSGIDAVTLGRSLEPLMGVYARYFVGVGLLAAGVTSAITAPLAAAYVAQGCFGLSTDLKNNKFRLTWMIVLIIGTILSSFGLKPIEMIQFAQVANGLLLPVIALVLIWIANKRKFMGDYSNTQFYNILSIIIVIITLILGSQSILKVFGVL